MFFESRSEPPVCSEPFAAAARLFHAGEVRQARRRLLELRRAGVQAGPEDALLASDVARGSGFHRESFAVLELARRHFPDHRRLAFEHCRAVSNRGRAVAALEGINALLDGAPADEEPLLLAARASVAAQVGFGRSAGADVDAVLARGEPRDPRVWHELAAASTALRRWQPAAEHARRAVAGAPRWPRARLFLAEAVIAQGRLEEARRIIDEGLAGGVEDAYLELVGAFQSFFAGDHAVALRRLVAYEYGWQRSRGGASLGRWIALMPWRLQDPEVDLAPLAEADEELWRTVREASRDGQHRRLLALPALRQARWLCVPTAVAMIGSAQGVELDPHELYEAMAGRQGTTTWRMVDELRRRGFSVRYVAARPQAVRGLLDQGVPLLGPLDGVFEAHVEVLCGYDAVREVLYVRDPESWVPGILPQAEMEERYALSGGGLIALLPPGREVVVERRWEAPLVEALVDLERACDGGDRRAAEAAYEAIPDDAPAAVRRDMAGRGVTLTPEATNRSLERRAADPETPPVGRLRALFALGSHGAFESVLDGLELDELGAPARRLLELLRLNFRGEWELLFRAAGEELERLPQSDFLWLLHAGAAVQLGRFDDAGRSVERALELAPDSPWVRARVRALFPTTRRLAEERAELESLEERYPDSRDLLHEWARLLAADADGLAYEAAEERCLRFFPRLPEVYTRLAGWYQAQERGDLAEACLARGRELVGAAALPAVDGAGGALEPAAEEEHGAFGHGALFRRARRALFGSVEEGEREGDGDDGGAAAEAAQRRRGRELLARLRELDHEGRLQWFETVDLRVLEMQVLVADRPGEEAVIEGVRALLEDAALPGPPGSALTLLLEQAPSGYLPRRAVASLRAWVEERAADLEHQPPGLRYQRARLAELSGDLNTALAELRRLTAEHPGFAEPFFALGNILIDQGQAEAALEAHLHAVEQHPGLVASLHAARGLQLHFGRLDAAVGLQRRLVRLLPYSLEELRELAVAVQRQQGAEAASREVERHAERFPAGTAGALQVELLVQAGDARQAVRHLDAHPEAEAADPDGARRVRIQEAMERGQPEVAEPLVDAALEATPGDGWLTDLKVGFLRERSADLLEFCRGQLVAGSQQMSAARGLLAALDARGERAREHLERSTPEERGQLAAALSAALESQGRGPEQLELLRWVDREVPELTGLRRELADRLYAWGVGDEAVAVARRLHEEDPEDVERTYLLAFMLQEPEPAEALGLFQEIHRRSGKVEALLYAGRCQQDLGRPHEAEETYREVLRQVPDQPMAALSLYTLGVGAAEVLPHFRLALERGLGSDLTLFHVAAVEVARQAGVTLPEAWEEGARRRFRDLVDGIGRPVGDERLQLALALERWLRMRGERDEARAVLRDCGSGWFRRQWVSRDWPGSLWVPPADAS